MPFPGAHTKAPALTTIGLGHAPETRASTRTPATGAVGLILGATASHFPNTESKRVIGRKTGTKGTLSPVLLIDTSREHSVPLPTPINVNKLEESTKGAPRSRLCGKAV